MIVDAEGGGGIDIVGILNYLPHRYPFLLVDRVLSLEVGKSISAIKNVSINEPFFTGHFPDFPIMPGVLILEAMGQAGGILAYASWPEEKRKYPLFLTGADKARFRRKVLPGDQIRMEVILMKLKSRAVKMRGVATVDGAVAVEAEFMAVLGD
ncbi:3-hydroxyacyl-[acyl-carrier-protein] dehydratase [Desulfobotulus alkaliphilus]|uniref:3-hydroxyacyl-[acyl-carrier-protein] dehydratase FabZ n=1 Tax=Desulfobotulus alkaliphilus TaxID=622671 RepID=A0A562RGI1_9BACT|nr:3-hydroxyacyl-ACP dehydratase FabZ [Desulfobotulus alkaliphilus]TWI68161.1 3-hydroxyacyl-[acyl-carrier-protein] dehydratase [Desulfobotulus alkaliphilus]